MKTRNKTSAQLIRRPTKARAISARGLGVIILLILLPPAGLLVLWRMGVFRARGRMLLTALATVEMTLLVVLLTPRPALTSQLPLPVAPQAVTQAPETDNLSALYNIEELLYQQQLEQVRAQGGEGDTEHRGVRRVQPRPALPRPAGVRHPVQQPGAHRAPGHAGGPEPLPGLQPAGLDGMMPSKGLSGPPKPPFVTETHKMSD